jgi:UDP-glucose 4-epimerase
LSEGKQVIALDRAGSIGEWSEFIAIDIASDAGMAAARNSDLVSGGGALIHCAGYAHRPIETPDEVERFFSINSDGTRRIVELCEAFGISRLVYLSSIAFYDWEGLAGQPATEDAQLSSSTSYARSKLDGESIVRESSCDWRVLRLATVYGRGDQANFSKLAAALKAGRFFIPGSGDARKSVIEVNRAAEYICRFSEIVTPAHRLVNLGFSQSPTLSEICGAFSEQCRFNSPRRLPLWFMNVIARCGDLLSQIKPSFPLTSINIGKLTRSTYVDSSRACEIFPELKTLEFSEELKQSADYYRAL